MKTIIFILGMNIYLFCGATTAIAQTHIDLYKAEKYDTALAPMTKAAKAGDAEAQFYLAKMYGDGLGVEQSYTEALRWYRLAADQDYAKAISNIGFYYHKGYGVEQDHAAAIGWWRRAAELGNATSQTNLGIMYKEGTGAQQNYARALRYFHMAAEQGVSNAQNYVGVMYENGQGVEKDYVQALKYYRLAAAQENKYALSNIGNMYNWGRGVARHCSKAMFYYSKAAELDHESSVERNAKLYEDGCRIYEPVKFPKNMVSVPVFEWKSPSPTLAAKMQNNVTFKYINEAQYTPWLIKREMATFRKGKRTNSISLTRHGSYTTLNHDPESGYSEWTLPNFQLSKSPDTPFWRVIKMEFFFDAGTTFADFEVPFQFRTCLSNTNKISFTVFNDGKLILRTNDGSGDIIRFRSNKAITSEGKTILEYRLSNEGQWMIYINGKLFGEGAFDKRYVNLGLSNKFWFEGATNIISLTVDEMYASENYISNSYGLSNSDLNIVDAHLMEFFDDKYIHLYDLYYDPNEGNNSFVRFPLEYYDSKGWQYEGHERIFIRRMNVTAKEGEYTAYRVGLIVTGKNEKGHSISVPFQYSMVIDESDKTIAGVMKLFFNSTDSPYIHAGPEIANVLAGE